MNTTTASRPLYWWAVVSLLALLLALLHWNTINLPLVRDEGEYAYSAWLLKQGILPYANSFMQKPPMIIYSYLAAGFLTASCWGARALSVFCTLAALVFLGQVVRREIDDNAALAAMFFTAPMLLLPGVEQFSASVEQFSILPIVLLWYLYLRDGEQRRDLNWVLGGLSSVVILLFKYNLAPLVVYILLSWLLAAWRAERKGVVRRLSWYVAGAVGGLFLILGFFLYGDGGASLYECTVVFNKWYALQHQFRFSSFVRNIAKLGSHWVPVLFLCLVFLLSKQRRRWFLLGLLLMSIITTSGSVYSHYYIVIMPFVATLAAGGISVLAKRLGNGSSTKASRFAICLTILFLVTLLWSDRQVLSMNSAEVEQVMHSPYPFSESVLAAEIVKKLAQPGDRVLVAGSEPQILYYAGVPSSTRFVILYPITIPTPLSQKFQIQAISEIETSKPKVIVMVDSPTSWLIDTEHLPLEFIQCLNRLQEGYSFLGGIVTQDGTSKWLPAGQEVSGKYKIRVFLRDH